MEMVACGSRSGVTDRASRARRCEALAAASARQGVLEVLEPERDVPGNRQLRMKRSAHRSGAHGVEAGLLADSFRPRRGRQSLG